MPRAGPRLPRAFPATRASAHGQCWQPARRSRACQLSAARIRDFVGADEERGKQRGLIPWSPRWPGLDRIPPADRAGACRGTRASIRRRAANGRERSWPAASRGEKGTVALLAAVGMQTSNWNAVPPRHLYFITAALKPGRARPLCADDRRRGHGQERDEAGRMSGVDGHGRRSAGPMRP